MSHARKRHRDAPLRTAEDLCPTVTIVIAVHNEEAGLADRLENCLSLSYPRDRLEILVASDGSTDGTVRVACEFARRYENIRVSAQESRGGKTAAQNAAVRESKSDVILFSDVDTKFDAHILEHITNPLIDPKVGCVVGGLLWVNPHNSAIAAGSDVYWRFERFLWREESLLGILAWGSGACLAVRRGLFRPMDAQYGEDCIVPLDIVSLGYRVVFQPDAIAYEPRISSPGAELRTRTRMTLRSFAGTLSRRHLLNPFRFPGISWAIISHKLLRWLTPYLLLSMLASNAALVDRPFYRLTFGLQALFYASAGLGHVLDRNRIRVPIVSTIYAFCLMNLGVGVGVAQAIGGRRIFAYRSEG
ncbi:MAG TPA: glycosyltransferase [bacterium]|nr:glycosyltransferase [bacterium]